MIKCLNESNVTRLHYSRQKRPIMKRRKKHYLEIMRIELDDLKEDIELMIKKCQQDHKNWKITERVFLENVTLFKNEILGIDKFSSILDQTDPDEFENLDDMISHIKDVFRKTRRVNEIAEAINVCIERKLTKVAKYVTQ
jgi:hypothetical protein